MQGQGQEMVEIRWWLRRTGGIWNTIGISEGFNFLCLLPRDLVAASSWGHADLVIVFVLLPISTNFGGLRRADVKFLRIAYPPEIWGRSSGTHRRLKSVKMCMNLGLDQCLADACGFSLDRGWRYCFHCHRGSTRKQYVRG